MNIEDIQDQISTKKLELKSLEDQLKEATKNKILCPNCFSYFAPDELMHGQFKEIVKNECCI